MKFTRPRRLLRFLVTWGSVAYLVALAGVIFLLEHCTERQWYFSPLLYLPPTGWLLPLVVLAPVAMFVRQSVLFLHVLAVMGVFMFYMHYHSPDEKAAARNPAGPVLTVLTANIGQRRPATVQRFINEWDPDVVAFQEGIYPAKAFTTGNPGYNVRIVDQFTLATKLPITDSGLVPDLTFEGRPVAAWFELRFQGRPIVIYNVHMPTPRSYFFDLRGEGFLAEFSRGGGIFSRETRDVYQYYWTSRFNLMRGLLAVLKNEKRPLLLMGDFNVPDHGELYRMLATEFTDTFAAVGKGYGQTFPGDAHVALAGFRPWLRLDYQFADDGWRPLECSVEHLTRAQHLAVAATYEMVGQ